MTRKSGGTGAPHHCFAEWPVGAEGGGRGDGTLMAPVCRALSGLDSGRDEKAMHALMGEIRSPIDKRMLGPMHSDSVYSGSWAPPMGF